jgi:hypothetical protein
MYEDEEEARERKGREKGRNFAGAGKLLVIEDERGTQRTGAMPPLLELCFLRAQPCYSRGERAEDRVRGLRIV